jgi:aspartyl-tRNA(Asn)/glutamyl-tRNA(Gln) amidotransferase subunit A
MGISLDALDPTAVLQGRDRRALRRQCGGIPTERRVTGLNDTAGPIAPTAEALRHADLDTQLLALTAGEVSAAELAEAYLAAALATRGSINAWITIDAERVRAEAAASDARRAGGVVGPLEGLCIGVKDNLDVAGLPTTNGMASRRHRAPAAADASAVARLRAAGAVILGKLSMQEAGLGADNDNPHYGACHLPQRHGWTPGGSSGGSAAAVAGGLCSAALGSDSMGSIRIPASYCGIWGLKASAGAISTGGLVTVSRRLDSVGPLARSAADLRRLVALLIGHDPACPASRRIVLAPADAHRIDFGVPDLASLGLTTAVASAFTRACAAITAAGHRVHRLPAPEPHPGELRRAGLLVCEAGMLVELAEDWRDQRGSFSPGLARMLTWAESKSAVDYAAADRQLDRATLQLAHWLGHCDVLLWPTTPQQSFAFGSPVPSNQADLTCYANMAGAPALSLPLPVADGELPIGLQLVGGPGEDLKLIAIGERLARLWEAA